MKSPNPCCVIPHVFLAFIITCVCSMHGDNFWLVLFVPAIYPALRAIQVFWMALAVIMQGRYVSIKVEDADG